jgi:phosphatidylinositol alpha-mannosyltransferase
MKVGLVCPYAWDVPGGVRSHVHDLALTLTERGYQVSVLAPAEDPSSLPPWVHDGGRPIAVPYNGSVARLSFGVKAAARVRGWIRSGDFDVVHIHEPLSPSLSLLACWSAQGPLVATWHSALDRSRVLSAGYSIAQTAAEKIRGHIAVSEDARRTLVAHVGGDAVLIPNGVRVEDYRDVPLSPLVDTRGPRVVFLGRIDESRKGLDVLLSAWPSVLESHPNAHLYVVGPGELDSRQEAMVSALGASVVFLGRLDDAAKASVLASATVYCAPHTGGESFGIVLVEAMAAGAPVVASDLPAFSRVLDGGACGRLFTTGDSEQLALALRAVIGDLELQSRLRTAGLLRAKAFDWQTVVADVTAVYDSVSIPGERVVEDLRGQVVGRLPGRSLYSRRPWRRP